LFSAAGGDPADSTCSQRPSEDFGAGLLPARQLASQPLAGRKIALIQETCGEGVDAGKAWLAWDAATQEQAMKLEKHFSKPI
jgi:hypothetical protein